MAVDNLTAVEFTFPKRCYSEKWRSEKLHSEKSEAPNLGLPPTVTKLIPTNLSHLNFISEFRPKYIEEGMAFPHLFTFWRGWGDDAAVSL